MQTPQRIATELAAKKAKTRLRRYFSKSAINILRGADRKITRRLFLKPQDVLRLAH